MTVKLLTEQHLEFLSLKRGCKGSFDSTLVKIPQCLKISCRGLIIALTAKSLYSLPIFGHSFDFFRWRFLAKARVELQFMHYLPHLYARDYSTESGRPVPLQSLTKQPLMLLRTMRCLWTTQAAWIYPVCMPSRQKRSRNTFLGMCIPIGLCPIN